MPRAFFVLAFHNELEYHNANARVNSGDDPSTSSENLMNFGPVTPEISLLICIPVFLKWAKVGLPTFLRRPGVTERIGRLQCQWAR